MNDRPIIDTERQGASEIARAFFSNLSATFTLVMVATMVLGMVFAGEEARQGIMYCWQILASCLIATLVQLVCFTSVLIKAMAYPKRLALFGVLLYALLAAAAHLMSWFPTDSGGAWVTFTLIYLFVFAIMTVFFQARLRYDRKELDARLRAYRETLGKDM